MSKSQLILLLPLLSLALLHTVVDTCALLVSPLWTQFESTFQLTGSSLSMIFIVQSMPTSISQVVFGYLRDRKASTYLVWLGPLFTVLCLTTIGIADDLFLLCALLVIGGIGVGAFHPDAAVVAGGMLEGNRTRGLSVFMFGGSLGLAIGPAISGFVTSQWGLLGLAALAPILLLVIPVLWWQIKRGLSLEPTTDEPTKKSLGEMMEGRVGLAVMLLLICSARLVPNMAMDKVIAFTLDRHGADQMMTGLLQSVFLTSASVGMFLMAMKFRSGWEKRFMVGCPLLGIPLICVLGWKDCPLWLFIGTLIPTGMVLWGTAPAMVSYAQQLFPKGAGLASALTMGMAWGIGGLIQAPITAYFRSIDEPQAAFFAYTPCLALAALGAWCLPFRSADEQQPAETT
ncbi:MAG: hypothetical protein CMJ78_10500 [Planctomycetaceae bacterium]|nr:hypothetical protein [Planctomycetaceae bacterium]